MPSAKIVDRTMPLLQKALDRATMLPRLATCLDLDGDVALGAARIVRHKPGRRCLIEYVLRCSAEGRAGRLVLLGKLRAEKLDTNGYGVQQALWADGFRKDCSDAIAVPEPVGTVPDLHMWLQRKVAGRPATDLFTPDADTVLAGRVAKALAKLHQARVATTRRWTLADEIAVLRVRLVEAASLRPSLGRRILAMLDSCEKLALLIPDAATTGIHRDFYPDQILVDGDRIYIVDLDLYAEGDPALDAGNFIAHLTEQALRLHGNPNALAHHEAALRERFLALSPQAMPEAIDAYAALTIARHVFLSTQFEDRKATTETLVSLGVIRLECAAARLRTRSS